MNHRALVGCAGIAILAAGLTLTGCGPIIRHESSNDFQGQYVAEASYDQVRPGQTTQDWVRATIGPPSSTSRLKDGGEVWQWSSVEQKNGSGAVWPVYEGSSRKRVNSRTYVEFSAEDVVRKKWRDSSSK